MQIRTDVISTSFTKCHLIFGGDEASTKKREDSDSLVKLHYDREFGVHTNHIFQNQYV